MMSRRNARDLVTDRVIDLETGLETDPETDPSRGESRRKEELSVDAAESPGSVSDDVMMKSLLLGATIQEANMILKHLLRHQRHLEERITHRNLLKPPDPAVSLNIRTTPR